MTAVASKILAGLVTAALSKITPSMLRAALDKVRPVAANVAGTLHVAELEKTILKALGYSSPIGLVVGFLSWIAANDATYIKDGALASLVSFSLGLVVDALRKAYSGEDPSLVVPPPSPSTSGKPSSQAKSLATLAEALAARPPAGNGATIFNGCPPESASLGCPGFTGKIVGPGPEPSA